MGALCGFSFESVMVEDALLNRRFTIVTGKGGVGKSVLAASLAMAYARAGKRTLLMQFTARDKIGPMLGSRPIGPEIVQLESNLFGVRPTLDEGLKEYVQMKLPRFMGDSAYKLVFRNDFVAKFLNALPALNELVMLGKAFNHERERTRSGRPTWDTIVLDAPATGHSMYLFQVPFVIREATPSGPMHREVSDMVSLLQDRRRTVLHLVTLPEEMPVNETIQLKADVTEKLKIPLGTVFCNTVFPRLFDVFEEETLPAIREAVPEDGGVLDRLVAAARFRVDRCHLQRRYVARLHEELGLPLVEIPFFFAPSLDRDIISEIADRIRLAAAGQVLSADEVLPTREGSSPS